MVVDENDDKVECNNCGGFFDQDHIRWGPDPYAEEIKGHYYEIYLCDDCYHESCMDI